MMACLFGSSENEEKRNRLGSQLRALKKELIAVQQENKELKSELDSSNNTNNTAMATQQELSQQLSEEIEKRETLKTKHDNEISTLQEQISTLEDEKTNAFTAQTNYNNEMEELKAENKLLRASQQLLQKNYKSGQEHIDKLLTQLQENNSPAVKTDDEKETEEPKKAKPKRYNLNKLQDQIEIIHSEGARAKSYLLCIKPQTVPQSGNGSKDFGFMDFLETSLSDKVVTQLFSKFKASKVDAKQLLSLLTLAVIIYRVKLHKMQTGSSTKPDVDSAKIKGSLEHLAAWIIRTFGEKSGATKMVSVQDDYGKVIEGRFDVYVAKFSQDTFASDMKIWVSKYIQSNGML